MPYIRKEDIDQEATINAPFTRKEVEALELTQDYGEAPYMCPQGHGILKVRCEDLYCSCGYTQEWVHKFRRVDASKISYADFRARVEQIQRKPLDG